MCVQRRGWWGGGNIDGLQRFVCFMGTGQSKQESRGEERGLFSRELGLIHFGWAGIHLGWDAGIHRIHEELRRMDGLGISNPPMRQGKQI